MSCVLVKLVINPVWLIFFGFLGVNTGGVGSYIYDKEPNTEAQPWFSVFGKPNYIITTATTSTSRTFTYCPTSGLITDLSAEKWRHLLQPCLQLQLHHWQYLELFLLVHSIVLYPNCPQQEENLSFMIYTHWSTCSFLTWLTINLKTISLSLCV